MDIQFDSCKKELAKLGILDIYVKRKLKNYYSKNFKKISPKQQAKIINDWKRKNSISSNLELNNWLNLYEINHEEWINLINSDYLWASWCIEKYKHQLSDYYISKKNELDMFFYSEIKVESKDLADELYIRIKEEESNFEEIAYEFSEGDEKYIKGRIGPVMIKNVETSISSLLKIGYINQLWQPKKINGNWYILRLDKILYSKFNTNLKLTLALELGDKFLNDKFLEIQTNKKTD